MHIFNVFQIAWADNTDEISREIDQTIQEIKQLGPEGVISHLTGLFMDFWPRLLASALAFVAGYLLIRALTSMTKRFLQHSHIDRTFHYFIGTTVNIILYGILIITCLGILGIPLTPMMAALGTAGLAISLAMQGTLSNLAGGIFILFARPFAKGNYVEIGGVAGTVRHIRLVYTVITTVDNKDIFMPNGDIAKAVVINYSARPNRRLDLAFPVRVGGDIALAKRIITEAVTSNQKSLAEPGPIVRVSDQSYAHIQISCFVWVNSADYLPLKAELIEEVRTKLHNAGL